MITKTIAECLFVPQSPKMGILYAYEWSSRTLEHFKVFGCVAPGEALGFCTRSQDKESRVSVPHIEGECDRSPICVS